VIHSKKERRYRCKRCSKTFSATKGSVLYRTHKPHELLTTVVTLMAYGCPVQAIVAAFGLDERTIHRWQLMSGQQCRRLHEHIVQAGGVPLAQVQADELRVYGSSAAWCGWPRRFRLVAGCGSAGRCGYGASAP
jgi:hypothetical protein